MGLSVSLGVYCMSVCRCWEASPPAGSGDMELQQPFVCQAGRGGLTLGPESSLDLATQILCVVLIVVFIHYSFSQKQFYICC